ncbi:sugar ABC transporter ATP-binding protein [Paenibacillus sp. GYB004]|uniref:sugar ABC transporter ATP-binding protein n=1 Tax=Paenibacillus sp. GYB004 TaxID=2994393 RepID=UPI002F962889
MSGMLKMKQIGKFFPGVRALSGVDFEVRSGEVHALLGANGAGKSTLMKVLSGAYTADEGTITIDGQAVSIRTPIDAKRAGVQCVYQEVDTALAPGLSVAENIMLDRLSYGSGGAFVSWGALRREAAAVLAGIGVTKLSVDKPAGELPISQKQLVLIARALAQKAKYIILDEPTAPLSLEETESLFRTMRTLKSEGVGLIFISHRLPEVFEICDRITVMRDGTRVSTVEASATSAPQVVETMLGKSLEEEFPKLQADIGSVLFQADNVHGSGKVHGVDLEVRSGEIVGIVGLVGAGKTELSRLLFAADRIDQGTLRMNGTALKLKEPQDAIRAGIVLVPEERRQQGVLIGESVKVNLTLPILKRLAPSGWIRGRAESKHSAQLVEQLGVKTPHIEQTVGYLSGGNQQKVAIGKWLPTEAKLYMFDEPTKGIDIGAKSDIFRLIGQLAQQGKGVLYLSSEMNEIIGISDRILVMCDGRIVKEFNRGEATEEQILLFASAGKEQEDEK